MHSYGRIFQTVLISNANANSNSNANANSNSNANSTSHSAPPASVTPTAKPTE